jgi:galacturan 1,4-alpha-galacturonidase
LDLIHSFKFDSTAMILSTLVLSLGALAAANPVPANSRRASCTFTDAASAISGKKSCSTITLKDITVPAGTTLDLTKLNDGTKVIFSGTTTFGYKEWAGPLISVSGNNILVEGAAGHVIDGNGAKWWDGKGSNGGKKKPKYACPVLFRSKSQLIVSQILLRP